MELEKYCWELDDRRPFRRFFAYIDAEENLADQLFIKHKVAVDFGPEFAKAGSEYFIIICSVWKKDRQRFLDALKELPDKMLLFGHTDYEAHCASIKKMLDARFEKDGETHNEADGTSHQAKQASTEGVS